MDINEAIQLALKHHRAGELQTAELIYREIIKAQPANPLAYNNLGNVLRDKGQLDEAVSCYQKAIELNPDIAMGYNNLGNVFQEKGRPDKAVFYYQKTLQLDPDFDMAQNNLANAYYSLGNSNSEKGLLEDAIDCYRKALQADPDLAGAYYCLADIFLKQNRFDEAIPYYKKALQFFPLNAELYSNIGYIFRQKGKPDEALHYYQKAVEINPEFAAAYNNMGSIYRYNGQIEEAITFFHKAIDINPEFADAYLNLGNVLQDSGRIAEAEDNYRKALQINPNSPVCYSNLLFTLNYDSRYTAGTIFHEHLLFAKYHAEALSSTIVTHVNDRSLLRRLKIGYCSPDFKKHPVARFIEPVLSAHNHDQFEIYCYMNFPIQDEVSERMRHYADHWRNISGMSDEKALELIGEDGIDILVDLAGHTANNRLLLFARKPAPVQVSCIGYLATTGLSAIDYRIADRYTDPPGFTGKYYTEKLVRLPDSFLCYLPDRESPEIGTLPALTAGHISFGSFNKLAKVSPEVISTWSELLKAVPESRLIMKAFSFFDGMTREHTINRFAQNGIAPERIILLSWDPSPKHLQSYNLVDIGLDTFPFNGAATTCEALWMGVPVITLEGAAYHSRAGISLLSNAGLTDFIAKTYDEYIQIAVNAASDIKKLQSLRQRLRDMMAHSSLTDAKRFTANLEKSYRTMWERWCKSA